MQVNPSTLKLSGANVNLIGKTSEYSCSRQDINGDGLSDLLCQVITNQFQLQSGATVAILNAATYAGQAVQGQEEIQIVP